jgi:hypothetical protein
MTFDQAARQAWYEDQIVGLTMLLYPQPLEEIDRLFKGWFRSTVFPLPFALDYCRDRALRGLSMPWEFWASKMPIAVRSKLE